MSELTIVADSSFFIALARIHQLDLLPKLAAKIVVPPAVWEEVTQQGRDRPGASEVSAVSWIDIVAPDPVMVEPLLLLLGRGEAEVLALGHRFSHPLLLLDDSRARRVAERLNLPRIGTVGLLRRGKQRGLLVRLQPLFESLIKNGIHIQSELIEAVLKDVGE